jgi:sarcosine oxidase subunit beta
MMTNVENLIRRAPAFEDASIMRGWAGFYEVTPDDNPLVGWAEGVEGIAVAAGFSGHGFMQGPAIGMCMAELMLNGSATTIDISPFRPSRFREGLLNQEHNVI